jgi:glutathione peroxidase
MFFVACGQRADSGDTTPGATKTNTEATMTTTAVDYRRIPFETIDGDTTNLAAFDGKVVLVVNTASKCGFTPQYAGLEELYNKYKDSGLVVIGFPANNFGGQEPGTNDEIASFCTVNYGVTFPMMAKVSVKGADKDPLFVELTEKAGIPGEIGWNFSKFLLDRHGKLVARFESKVTPMSDELTGAIRKLL